MEDDCKLCVLHQEENRVVYKAEKVYSIIPHAPMSVGHVMILPYRHTRFEELNIEELLQLRDMSGKLKDKLVELYPSTPPIFISVMDTAHASIPDHFHYHLIPSKTRFSELLAAYYGRSAERVILPESELELMAQRLRG